MKQKIKKLLLLFLALFIVGEIVVRLVNLTGKYQTGLIYKNIVVKKKYWHLKPNLKISHPSRVGNIKYTANRVGFRTKNHKPNSKKYRILVAGDSVSFGLSVNDDKTYPVLLEKKLSQANKYSQGVEVINLGIFSYGVSQELHVTKEIGLPLKPNVIFLQLYMNDFFLRVEKHQTAIKYGLWQRIRNVFWVGTRTLTSMSAFYVRLEQGAHMMSYWLIHDWKRRNPKSLNQAEPLAQMKLFQKNPYSRIVGFDELIEFRKLAKSQGLPLIVMLTPNESQLFFQKYDLINNKVRDFCQKHGIYFIDSLPMLRKDKKKEMLFLDGLHFSAYGNKVLSNWLASRWGSMIKGATSTLQKVELEPALRSVSKENPLDSPKPSKGVTK